MIQKQFNYNNKNLTVVIEDNKYWFKELDIMSILNITNRNAIKEIAGKNEIQMPKVKDRRGRPQPTWLISEKGFKKVIKRSLMSATDKADFISWIDNEVIVNNNVEIVVPVIEPMITKADFIKAICNQLEPFINDYKEKTAFIEVLKQSQNGMSVRIVADILTPIYGLGEIKLFNWLRDKEYLYYDKHKNNLPKKQYIEEKLFLVTLDSFQNENNEIIMYPKTLVTIKGLIQIINDLEAEKE